MSYTSSAAYYRLTVTWRPIPQIYSTDTKQYLIWSWRSSFLFAKQINFEIFMQSKTGSSWNLDLISRFFFNIRFSVFFFLVCYGWVRHRRLYLSLLMPVHYKSDWTETDLKFKLVSFCGGDFFFLGCGKAGMKKLIQISLRWHRWLRVIRKFLTFLRRLCWLRDRFYFCNFWVRVNLRQTFLGVQFES